MVAETSFLRLWREITDTPKAIKCDFNRKKEKKSRPYMWIDFFFLPSCSLFSAFPQSVDGFFCHYSSVEGVRLFLEHRARMNTVSASLFL